MAWWSFIVEPLKQVAKAVVMDVVVEGIKWVGEKIKNFFSDAGESIGNTSAYDAEKATIGDTKQLNDELAKIKNQAIEYGEKLENDFLQSGKEAVESLIEQIRQVDSIDTSSFKRQCNRILREFKGTIAKNISTKISLSDDDFLAIAALQAGDDKRQKAVAFCQSVAKKAFKEVAENFTNSLSTSIKNVTNLLNVKLESEQSIIKNTQSTLDKIKKAQKKEQKQQEQVNLALDLCKKEALLTKMDS